MSGRIRSIKPEWLDDERLGTLSDAARLLSVGLILLADDWGNGRASEAFLTGRVWGYSGDGSAAFVRCSCAFRELAEAEFLAPYEHRGQSYYHIRKWFDHQKVDKPGRPLCPMPSSVVADLPKRWAAAWKAVSSRYGVEPFDAPVVPHSCPVRADGTTDRDQDRDREEETDPRATARESSPSPLDESERYHDLARRLVVSGYQRRYEEAEGQMWQSQNARGNRQATETIVAFVVAESRATADEEMGVDDMIPRVAKAMLDGFFRLKGAKPLAWLAEDPGYYVREGVAA